MNMEAIISSAVFARAIHIQHCFECWVAGDVAGIRISWRGAQRCEHVIRLAKAMM
jgi:hypothetical protein